jgi:hypothetical protein
MLNCHWGEPYRIQPPLTATYKRKPGIKDRGKGGGDYRVRSTDLEGGREANRYPLPPSFGRGVFYRALLRRRSRRSLAPTRDS